MSYRSKKILGEEDSAFARSLFKAMGYTDSELKMGKPLIGIANTWNTLDPGHFGLDKVAEAVKNGIYAAGGHLQHSVPSLPATASLRATKV